MVGVVNPSSDQTLDKYKSAAKSSKNNVSPDSPYGGLGASSDKTSAARAYQPVGGVAAVAAAAAAALT